VMNLLSCGKDFHIDLYSPMPLVILVNSRKLHLHGFAIFEES
jgi:hypothetical protein